MSRGMAEVHEVAARRSIPLTVQLELTYRCNARCIHCFQERSAGPRELSSEEWVAVVGQARSAGALFLSISGGEAMLSPHFWTVVGEARALGMAFRVYTNGLLLTRENVDRLATARPHEVAVSLFSLRPERHDAVTGVAGSFRRTLRGLFRLARAGIPLRLNCPLLAPSAADHGSVKRLAERLGAGVAFDPAIHPGVAGGAAPTRCRGDDDDLVSFFSDVSIRGNDPARTAPVAADRAPCGVGRSFAVVSPWGDLLPCPALAIPAGNLREASLDVLWRESPLFQKLRARRFGDLKECATCPRSGYCGRCSAVALLEDGDLDGPSSRACHIAELREKAWGVPRPPGAPEPRRPRLRVLQG